MMLAILLLQTRAKIVGQSSHITIIRGNSRKLLGIFEGGTDVSSIAAESDER